MHSRISNFHQDNCAAGSVFERHGHAIAEDRSWTGDCEDRCRVFYFWMGCAIIPGLGRADHPPRFEIETTADEINTLGGSTAGFWAYPTTGCNPTDSLQAMGANGLRARPAANL